MVTPKPSKSSRICWRFFKIPSIPSTHVDSTDLWHKRICHLNYQTAHHMIEKNLVDVVTYLEVEKERQCEYCVLNKHHRSTKVKTLAKRAIKPLELIHSNLCGPLRSTGWCYVLTFTEGFSRFTWLYFLKPKSETLTLFQHFVALVITSFPHKVANLSFCDHDWSHKVSNICSHQATNTPRLPSKTIFLVKTSISNWLRPTLRIWMENLSERFVHLLNMLDVSSTLVSSLPISGQRQYERSTMYVIDVIFKHYICLLPAKICLFVYPIFHIFEQLDALYTCIYFRQSKLNRR